MNTQAPSVPPSAQMLELITGYWVSQAVYCIAKLGVADQIGDGEKSAEELARATGSHAPSLYRVLRALTTKGVLVERPGERFALTPVGATLRKDAPGSMRNFALMMIDDYSWRGWAALEHSVRTGEIAFDKVFGMPVFEFMAQHPDKAKAFGDSMTDLSRVETPAVVDAYDFSRFEKLVDVGGSHGILLASILRRHPKLKGVLYDSPHVIENAKNEVHVTAKDVAGRIETVAGNFFESVPAGADAYMMKYILHDWEDAKSLRILQNCRRAVRPKGALLVIDTVVRPGEVNGWSKWMDVNMLALVGGKERTEDDFRALFEQAGFRLTRVVPTACPLSIVEGVAV